MKRFVPGLLIFGLAILFTGCAYDSATVTFAKKHNLSMQLYNDVKIKCITNQNINSVKEQMKISKYIGNAIGNFYVSNCRTKYYQLVRMGVANAKLIYNNCLLNAKYSRVSIKDKKQNNANISDLTIVNRYGKYHIGYYGTEKVGDKFILFYKPEIDYKDVLDSGLSSYIRNSNLKCKKVK